MMFFQDTRSIGLIFWIVAILLMINAAIILLGAFTEDIVLIPDYVTDVQMYCLLAGFGSLIVSLLYAARAHKAMSKKNTRMEILHGYVLTVGLCSLLGNSIVGLAEYLYTDQPENGMILTGFSILMGIIVVLVAFVITNGKKGLFKKVIWAILVIAFVLMAIGALTPAENYWEYIEHIAHLLIAFFMLALIADGDIRTEMGVKS